jgi:hypothetical protein
MVRVLWNCHYHGWPQNRRAKIEVVATSILPESSRTGATGARPIRPTSLFRVLLLSFEENYNGPQKKETAAVSRIAMYTRDRDTSLTV